MLRTLVTILALSLITTLAACEKAKPAASETPAAPSNAATPLPAGLPTGLFLTTAPADPKNIKDAKPALKAGDKVVLIGRIGGSDEPFVEQRAMFTLVDRRMKTCNEDSPMPHCKTPWDYCCDSREDITANSATIQIAGPDGQPVKTELNGLRGLKPMATVTVVGTIATADGPNVVVNASQFYVQP